MSLTLSDNDYLKSIWVALTRLEGLLSIPATAAPQPNIVVSPPDLSEIVTAVTGLRPSVTAEEIARAIGEALHFPEPQNANAALSEVAEALKKLEFRLKGMGTQAYGGGAVTLERGQTIATTLPPADVDANNTTTTPLAAGASFVGTATNILPYMQVNLMLYGLPSTAMGSLYFEFSPDATNWDISIPILVSDPTYFIPYPLINVGKFFRVRYINDGGAAFYTSVGSSTTPSTPTLQTQFRLTTMLYTRPSKELARTLGQTINDSQPVGLVRSVSTGTNPDGAYVNASLGGTRTLSPATSVLGSNGVYTSGWMDTETYPTVKLLVATDQASASNGITLQWSDTAAGTTVQTTESHTFNSGYTASGRLIIAATRTRYLRIIYTNGTTPQTRFFLNLRLNPVPVVADVGLIPSSAGATGQQTVTTTATALSGTGLAGRDAFRLKNMSTSARPMFYGFAGSLTTANGDELAAGESVELDLDETVSVYVITTSTGGAGVQASWLEIA